MIGQISYPKLSQKTDYLQLDICGLNKDECINKYLKYNKSIPIILHGDWTKKGFSENNIKERYKDYIEIINSLKELTTVIAITIHPPFRNKISKTEFLNYCKEITIQTSIDCFIENRSNQKIWFSSIEEIVELSKTHYMTIDIPQLFIRSDYNYDLLLKNLELINWKNVKEIHLANVIKTEKNTFVGRQLKDGIFNIEDFKKILEKTLYITLEILGGVKIFENNKQLLEMIIPNPISYENL